MQEFERLEKEWAEFNELEPENMVVCNSGTAALHLAFETLKLFFPEIVDRYVLCPDFAMVACPRAISLAGLVPVFHDVGFNSRVIDEYSAPHPYKQPYASLLVHTYGRKSAFIKPHRDGVVVEDMSEAHGLPVNPNSDAACWSFYRNKIVAGEEGGAVYFKDPMAANYARQLRCIGMGPVHNFKVVPRGMNYRLSNCHATLILDSLENFQTNWAKRWDLWEAYDNQIGTTETKAPWVYDFILPAYLTPEFVVNYFNKKDIAARYGFYPNHKQTEWMNDTRALEGFPVTDQLYKSLMYFPIDPEMDLNDVDKICDLYEELLH